MRIVIETQEPGVTVHDPLRNGHTMIDGGPAENAAPGDATSIMSAEADVGSPPAWLVEEIGRASSEGTQHYAMNKSNTSVAADGGSAAVSEKKDS